MPIDFHDKQNRMTYTERIADETWVHTIQENLDVRGKQVIDIGCGGGIYSKALAQMGAAEVIGVDFSAEMLKGAAINCKDTHNVRFLHGDAYHTKLPSHHSDIVLERALIHHLDNLISCFKEASRILKKNGILIIQDRTPDDCLLQGNQNHIRGYFFEKFPKLEEKETSRRHSSENVIAALANTGFELIKEVKLWEIRRVYKDLNTLKEDLLLRKGRSILYELWDDELKELVAFILEKLADKQTPIIEKDCWSVWFAMKQ